MDTSVMDERAEQHNIRVCVRVRPLNQLEKELKNESIWSTSGRYDPHSDSVQFESGSHFKNWIELLLPVQLRD
jgi:hypothetical protein